MAVLSLDGHLLEVNRAFARLMGRAPEEMLGRILRDFTHPEDVAATEAAMAELRAHGGQVEFEKRLLHKDGHAVWVHIAKTLVPDAQGQPREILCQAHDVSARRTTQEQLRQELERLRRQHEMILESVGEGILGVDAAGNISFINAAGARMLGYDPGDLLGKPHHAAIHHARPDGTPLPEERCPVAGTLRDGSVHHATGDVFWRKDRRPLPVDYTSAPIREGGRIVGAAVIFGDTSERGNVQEAERRANQKVVRIYESIPEAFFALDKDWHLVYMNPLAERMRSTPKERVLGKVLWEAFPDLKGTKFDTEYHRAVAERVPVVVEEFYPRMGRWFEATAYPTEEGLSVYFRDITARKRSEEELKAASITRPLARKIVGDLVDAGSVAHQILSQVGRKLAAETASKTLEEYIQAYTDMGLGKVELEKNEGGRAAFHGQDLLEKRSGSRVATCYFTLGYLSEAVSRINGGEPTLGTEIECQSRGAHECRFIVQVKKPEEGLARRVKELI